MLELWGLTLVGGTLAVTVVILAWQALHAAATSRQALVLLVLGVAVFAVLWSLG